MKVTVTQLPDDRAQFSESWLQLVEHTQAMQSEFVLLPELIFSAWIFDAEEGSEPVWQAAVEEHQQWLLRLPELGVTCVAGTYPTLDKFNSGFSWEPGQQTFQAVHEKAYLPNEATCWEQNWYTPGSEKFDAASCGGATCGFLICTELWFSDCARKYAAQGADLVLVPRGTEKASAEKWIVGGRSAAISSGAYCLSANRVGLSEAGTQFGGAGWIIDPDGEVLAVTSEEEPFITLEIDLALTQHAKTTYPRNVYLSA